MLYKHHSYKSPNYPSLLNMWTAGTTRHITSVYDIVLTEITQTTLPNVIIGHEKAVSMLIINCYMRFNTYINWFCIVFCAVYAYLITVHIDMTSLRAI